MKTLKIFHNGVRRWNYVNYRLLHRSRKMQELFQNGRDAGVFAVGSDGSDPPAGNRKNLGKAVRQDRKESGAYPQREKNFWSMPTRILYDVHQAKASMNDTDELKIHFTFGTIESLCTVKFPKIIRKFRGTVSQGFYSDHGRFSGKADQMMEHK